jgi:hypothetical protein
MPVAQSPARYINSSKGCPSITESFPLCFLLVQKMSLSPLARHCQWCNPIGERNETYDNSRAARYEQLLNVNSCQPYIYSIWPGGL